MIPPYVIDGPRDEYQKDATTANVEPTDVHLKRQMLYQIPLIFARDIKPCIDVCLWNKIFDPFIP